MVAERTKRTLTRIMGPRLMQRYYRLTFTVVSIATTAAVAHVIYATPDTHIWSAPLWLSIMMQAARIVAVIFAVRSFWGFSLAEFTGVTQATNPATGGDMEGMRSSDVLITDGGYAVVRNPLYFAGIVIMSLDPTISSNGLIVSAIADLYFVFGALIEERRMLARFGDAYRLYKMDVPLLVPNPVRLLSFTFGWPK